MCILYSDLEHKFTRVAAVSLEPIDNLKLTWKDATCLKHTCSPSSHALNCVCINRFIKKSLFVSEYTRSPSFHFQGEARRKRCGLSSDMKTIIALSYLIYGVQVFKFWCVIVCLFVQHFSLPNQPSCCFADQPYKTQKFVCTLYLP